MKDYWLWIGGTMIFLNFANFLYAEFRISVMSIAKQRLWAFYVMLTLIFEAFIGVLSVFELLSERPDKYLWLIIGGASVVFSCFSIIVLRQQFVRALEGGVYTFKITDKSYRPTRLFGEFDTAVSRRPLSAELDVKNKDRYKSEIRCRWRSVIVLMIRSIFRPDGKYDNCRSLRLTFCKNLPVCGGGFCLFN